jgi:hypothetical protein
MVMLEIINAIKSKCYHRSNLATTCKQSNQYQSLCELCVGACKPVIKSNVRDNQCSHDKCYHRSDPDTLCKKCNR